MKRDLLLGLALVAGSAAWAASSPYAGNEAAEGTYYLYQVETGTWLQCNNTVMDTWTTYGSLGETGFDIQLIKPEGYEGFRIFCRLTGNGCLNGADQDRFYLDQSDRAETDWIFEPVSVDGVTNAYKIMAKATPEGTNERSAIANDFYIGANDDHMLSDQPTLTTWQLVSREERLAKMQQDVANGPVDCSWLIPWNDMGRNDMRDRVWDKTVNNPQGGGTGFGGTRGYPVQEYWHQITMNLQYTLEDLPTGTYAFTIQGYYRDTEIESAELAQRHLDGTENMRAFYFAGASNGTVKSIYDEAKADQTDGYSYHATFEGVADLGWVPNSVDDASIAMFNGAYKNDYIQAPVTDGTLTIGVKKPSADYRDWLIHKRFFLQYVSATPIDEDLSALFAQYDELIAEAETLPQTPTFAAIVANAKEQRQTITGASKLLAAINDLQNAIKVIKDSKDNIANFYLVKAITDQMGIDPTEAVEQFNNATTTDGYFNALRTLRYARRLAVADKQADVFTGSEPTTGRFYIYNLGKQMFLTGGSDWGAHAALGIPGTEIELIEQGISDKTGLMKYAIETGLYNSDVHHYLGTRGYMDQTIDASNFSFVPVEGKDKVYHIIQGDWPDVHAAWDPYGSTDQGNNDELNVCTESRNLDETDLNAQWKLVTRDERDALIEKASLENPVDLTHYISNPGFNQRASVDNWATDGFGFVRRGENRNDFVCEAYNQSAADLSTMVGGLPAGIYKACVQGYFRAGEISEQVNAEQLQYASFYAGNNMDDDVLLPNILTESGNVPGEGDNIANEDGTITYQVPNSPEQATYYFKAGLYRTSTVIELTADDIANDVPIGISQIGTYANGDWVVVDNFRLYYYGTETTKDEVKNYTPSTTAIDEIADVASERPADNRIFNLQGIQVANPTHPGVYIQNGKKFIVR